MNTNVSMWVCTNDSECGNFPFGRCLNTIDYGPLCHCAYGFSGPDCGRSVGDWRSASISTRALFCVIYSFLFFLWLHRMRPIVATLRVGGERREIVLSTLGIVLGAGWSITCQLVAFLIDPHGFDRILTGYVENFLHAQAQFAMVSSYSLVIILWVRMVFWCKLSDSVVLSHLHHIILPILAFLWFFDTTMQFALESPVENSEAIQLARLAYIATYGVYVVLILVFTFVFGQIIRVRVNLKDEHSQISSKKKSSLARVLALVVSTTITMIFALVVIIGTIVVDRRIWFPSNRDYDQVLRWIFARALLGDITVASVTIVILVVIAPPNPHETSRDPTSPGDSLPSSDTVSAGLGPHDR